MTSSKRSDSLVLVFALFWVSFCLRLYLAPLLAFPLDMDLMIHWGHFAANKGVTHIADAAPGEKREMYPPLFHYQNDLLTRIGSSRLERLEKDYPAVANVWERVRFKLVPIGYDLLTGLVIFLILTRLVARPLAIAGLAAYLLNPCIFINSAWVGQVDCVHSLFLFGTILFLWRGFCGKAYWFPIAWAMFAVAACYKLQSIVLLPLLLTLLWIQRKTLPALTGPLAGLLCGLAIYSPFLIAGRWDYLDHVFIRSFTVSTFTQLNAFNFWGLGNVRPTSETILGISYARIGLICYLATSLWLFLAFVRSKMHPNNPSEILRQLCVAAAYACVAPFMVLTAMHERYIAPAIVFLIVSSFLDRRLRWLAIGFSTTYTLNLFFVLRPGNLPPDALAIRNAMNFALRICCTLLNSGMFIWFTARLQTLLQPQAIDPKESFVGTGSASTPIAPSR